MGSKVTRTRQRWGMLAAASVLLALAAIALAFQGAPVFTAMRFTPPTAELRPRTGAEEATGTPAPREQLEVARIDLSWITVAVVILLVVVAIALLWRYLLRRLRRAAGEQPGALAGTAEGGIPAPPPAPPEQPRPEPVRRGLDRALDLLAEPREPRDAVERAWLGLEEGAADAGVRRLPAETPGEFAARVVARVASDRAAAQELLDLYLRARFSEAPVTADDVAAARAAVVSLRASWTGAAAR